MHETQMHEQNCFVTLTYNEENLPKDNSLDVSHWQKFAKRLRKKSKFRFFHCGEYGDKNARPHYHAILFGVDFSDKVEIKNNNSRFNSKGEWGKLYTSRYLEETWKLGFVTVGEATWQSAAYVARYIMKKKFGDQAEDHYGGRKPEYITMSRGGTGGQGGIGKSWLEKYKSDVYPHDEVVVDGKKMMPPKYYDNQLDENEILTYREQRKVKALERDTTPERLKAREKIVEARLKQLNRDL